MGIRVYFYAGGKNGASDLFLSSPLQEFRSWIVYQIENYENQENGNYEGEYVTEIESEMLPLLDSVIAHGQGALFPKTLEESRRIDQLLSHFYFWCDRKNNKHVKEIADTFKLYRYREISTEVQQYFGDETQRLWNFIFLGRSICQPEGIYPYHPIEEIFAISFWTFDEVGFLYFRMKPLKQDFPEIFQENIDSIQSAFQAIEYAFKNNIGVVIQVA